jgi:hypothetical protein
MRTFLWRPEWLAAQRAALNADGRRRALLIRQAEAALKRERYSVVDKPRAAGSGDKHDYLSIGPYWWPDASKPDGQPYRRRDGQVNPERSSSSFDAQRSAGFARDVETLAMAWHVSGDRRYAEKAAALLRAWFLDPATLMNPNLNYAQAVAGVSAGRPEGVIDAIRLTGVIEAVGVLGPSHVLSDDDQRAIERWFGDLARWMVTSPNGQAEERAANNHGIYYDMLLAQFALFARNEPLAARLASNFAVRRLARQVDPSGAMPAEAARTRAWHYSVFAVRAAVQMAMLGECVGVDLWLDKRTDLQRAVRYLASFRGRIDSWPAEDIDLADPKRRESVLAETDTMLTMAAWGLRNPALAAAEPSAATQPLWLAPYPVHASRTSP